ncbi:MAG: hypothetical protein CMQ41_13095 [Gammaproteobacteria bacterium]|nr:hypothetical protein [Gammaproteobacteria bacterium]|tara:strand:+ start:1251 stop:1982 length:732 start_codon:yes stop_codon:yes gene_type:complete
MYIPKLSIITLLIFCTSHGYGQNESNSTASRSAIQAYLEQQRQVSTAFHPMARMQVDMQYGDFLNSLGRDEPYRSKAEEVLIDVLAERAEFSSQVANGQIAPEKLREISSYQYLRDRMKAVLNSTDLQLLDNRREGLAEEQLRKTYLQQLNRISPKVTPANQEIVLDVLIEHMLIQKKDPIQRNRVTAEELIQRQLMSLLQARVELQNLIEGEGEQQEMVDIYLNELRSNLFLNQSMSSESAQ